MKSFFMGLRKHNECLDRFLHQGISSHPKIEKLNIHPQSYDLLSFVIFLINEKVKVLDPIDFH